MKMIKSLKNKMVVRTQVKLMKVAEKLIEEVGADSSTEKGGWIIAVLILVGLAIGFINKFFPTFFNSIGDKLMEMFNLIKFN